MIKSRICDDIGIEYPVFQGGMAWVADAALAAAVSEAGGLGIIAGMNMTGEELRSEIRKCRSRTDRPFGVNIMLMSPHAAEAAEVVTEENVPVITTGAGNPVTYMPKWIDAGIKVIPLIGSVAHAKMVAKRGAYAVIAEGCESGGHIGEISTLPLVREVCGAVDIPVIAAGGIADGHGLAAALMLGASGVQMGTAFLVTDECGIHDNYKDLVLKAGDRETIVTGGPTGHPVRSLKSPLTRHLKETEGREDVSPEEAEKAAEGALRRAVKDGNVETGSFMCGEIAGMVNERKSCRELICGICSEAEELLKSAPSLVI